MPGTINHVLTATTPDDPGYEIRPSHWNSAHAVTINAAGSEISGAFSNANGASFGLSGTALTLSYTVPSVAAFLTTAMLSNASTAFAGIGETTSTQAGTAIGLTVDTAGVNIAYPNILTTAALSNHSHGNPALSLTNLSGTTGSNSAGLTLSLSAAPYLSTFLANGVTLPGYSTSSTYSSMAFGGVGLASVGFDAAAGVLIAVNACGPGTSITTTAGTDLKATVDTNGLAIAHPAWLTTAQPVGAYLTTARASNDAVGLNTAQTNVTWTVNSAGISVNAAGYAGTGTSATNASVTLNSNGLAISVAAPGASGGAALKGSGTYTQNTGTVEFANSNGITFGLSNNGTMTAAHNGLTTARASNDAVGLNTALTAGPLAWTVNSGGISLNAGSAAGTSTGFTGANISASITHNTAGIAISASVAAPGGGADKSASWHRINEMVTTAALWNNATFSNRPMFVPFKMQEAITAVNSVDIYVSRTGGTSVAATLHWGVYTLANATSMNLISSTSFNISLTTSAQFSGIRRLQFTGLGALSLSPGQYVMGLLASQAGTASWGMNAMGIGSAAIVGVIHPGTNSTAATATNTLAEPFMGVWNANSAALPSAVAASSVRGGLGGNNALVYAIIKAIT